MYVRNIAGYNFAFKYRDSVIYIPYDGKIYSIPDDSGRYSELKVILPMNIKTQPVTYINKDGNVASENLCGHKRRGRPPKEDKILNKYRVSKEDEPKHLQPDEPVKEKFVVDVDINEELLAGNDDSVETDKEEKSTKTAKTSKTAKTAKTTKTTKSKATTKSTKTSKTTKSKTDKK